MSTVSNDSPQEFLETLKNRRSIGPKEYNGEKLSENEMEMILEAGNWAPTHGTTQPWRYVIYSSEKSITEYLDFLENYYHENSDTISEEDAAKFKKKFGGVSTEWPFKGIFYHF